MKRCTVCKLNLELTEFHIRKSSKDGFDYTCKLCKSKKDKEYRIKKLDKIKERKQKYYIKNKHEINLTTKLNYYKNKKLRLENISKWKKENRHKVNFNCAKRRNAKLNRNIYDNDEYHSFVLEEAYALAQIRFNFLNKKYHVDHIVPLLGKTVSGLHVVANIQVIPAIENCSKRADYWPDMWERHGKST